MHNTGIPLKDITNGNITWIVLDYLWLLFLLIYIMTGFFPVNHNNNKSMGQFLSPMNLNLITNTSNRPWSNLNPVHNGTTTERNCDP